MPKFLAVSGAVVLGVALAVVPAIAASAHTPTYTLTCSSVHVSLTSYDAAATATVVVDGVTKQTGTFTGTYLLDISFDPAIATHSLAIDVDSTQGTDGTEYDVHDALSVKDCVVTPPSPDAAAAAVTSPATCTAAGAVIFSLSNATWDDAADLTDGSRNATATSGHVFSGGLPTTTVTYSIPPQLTGSACAQLPTLPLPPQAPPTTSLDQLPTLAYTGASDMLPTALVAMALLLVGGFTVWAARRRTR